jgi:large subunit ribosomal protein L15
MIKSLIMNLSNLRPAKGAVKKEKRIGRGEGSGRGGTSTKGHKGAKSRSGYSKKKGFEGGQMPLQRRVPKFGFTNFNRVEYKPVNLDQIQTLVDSLNLTSVTFETLLENSIVGKNDRVKLLGRGELKTKVDIKLHSVSSSAKAVIENLGGKVEIIA